MAKEVGWSAHQQWCLPAVIVQELRLSDPLAYRNFLRMDEESFLEVS